MYIQFRHHLYLLVISDSELEHHHVRYFIYKRVMFHSQMLHGAGIFIYQHLT